MLRALVTYLLLLNLFNVSLLKLQKDATLCSVFFKKSDRTNTYNALEDDYAQLKANKNHSLPEKAIATIDILPIENENESECKSLFEYPFLIEDNPIQDPNTFKFESLLFHVSAYEHVKINIHFLDIFSPPPNC